MEATITTANPNGLGYQTGLFSAPVGEPIDQNFFDAAFAGRLNPNPIYKEVYNCDIIGECGISQWLDEFMDVETDCYDEVTLLETHSLREQIRVAAGVTIPAYPATGQITLSEGDHFVSGQYVLPQVGNSLILPPTGKIVDITAVTHATGFDTILTVRHRANVSGTSVLIEGDEPFVLSGSFIEDCACPTGQFAVEDLLLERDISMIHFGDKGELCGDALDTCKWLKIPFRDENGNVLEEKWWSEPLRKMYQRFEKRKTKEDLFNDKFGIIPQVKARGLKFTPASASEITIDDLRTWVAQLDLYGIYNREYAIFAGTAIYSQLQRMLDAAGVTRMSYDRQPMNDCKWLNLEWCGVVVEGLTLHIYKECSFSNGKEFGGQSYVFPNSALFVPMGTNRSTINSTSRGMESPIGNQGKLFSRVYFRSNANGQVFDAVTDSNGILNGPGGRNTFGTGCREHEWTIESRYRNEIYCIDAWGYIGLS